MSTALDLAWISIIAYGMATAKLSKHSGTSKGQEKWDVMKLAIEQWIHTLDDPTVVQFEWKHTCMAFYDELKGLGVIDEKTEEVSQREWEVNHFLIQHGRIPKKNPTNVSIVRLFQIAFNSGQANITNMKNEKILSVYPKQQLRYYDENRLAYVDSYIDEETFNKLNRVIETTGFLNVLCGEREKVIKELAISL